MTILCVDSNRLQIWRLMRLCRRQSYLGQSCLGHGKKTKTVGFTSAKKALAWLENSSADIALLEINEQYTNCLTLAERIKELCTGIKIIFISESKEYATEAFQIHPSGYILKPVSTVSLAKEIDYALSDH